MNKSIQEVVDFLKFIRAHFVALLSIILITTIAFVITAKIFIPITYKSFSVLTIPTRYFQQISFDDIIPSVQDPSEMRTLRDSLLKNAITDNFLENLGEKYKLISAQSEDFRSHQIQLQKLRSRIEIISIDPTSFQIGFIGADPEMTFQIAKDLFAEVKDQLLKSRSNKLINLRNNFLARADSLGITLHQATDPLSVTRPDALNSELANVRKLINTASARYTAAHPLIKQYKNREKLILNLIGSSTHSNVEAKTLSSGTTKIERQGQSLTSPQGVDSERYSDLIKRIETLNVLLDFESTDSENLVIQRQIPSYPMQSLTPKMTLVLFWGLFTSLLLCSLYLAVQNYLQKPKSVRNFSSMDSRGVSFDEDDFLSTNTTEIKNNSNQKNIELDII